MITRKELAAALDKWADQDHYPTRKLIADDGCLCCLGMIARECFGASDFDLRNDDRPVLTLLRDSLGDDFCDHIVYANDELVENGHPPHIVVKSIMNEYDEQEKIHDIRDLYGNTSAT